jgi:hypothetical protein
MKRQRGRGRKPGGGGGHQPNRTLESNGPDVKIRGSASHIYEKYLQLSRDASSAGDRVMSESYAQYAEHYFRMLRAMQPQQTYFDPQRFSGPDYDYDQEEGEELEGAEGAGETRESGGEAAAGEQPYPNGREQRQPYQGERQGERQGGGYRDRPQHGYRERGERGERAERPEPGGEYAGEQRQEFGGGEEQGFEGGQEGGGYRGGRRRRNRGRYRPDGDRAAPRQEGDSQGAGPVEGFGDSIPAFVSED